MASAAEQLASNLNFAAFAKAEDLKKRIWFTLGALLVYRLGTYIPLPGINPDAFAQAFQQQSGGVLGMFNMFAGGAVERMAIFALGIMPYISASIIMQLMTSVIPTLEQLKKEGEQGRKVINQYTRYGTVLLAVVQAYGISVGLEGGQGIVTDPGIFFRISAVITLVGGTMFLMWLGEQITARGIGNGISLIIFAGIVAALPSAIAGTLAQMFGLAQQGLMSPFTLLLGVAGGIAVVVFEKPATVAGSRSSDEAKIGGMTPDVLSFSGRCEVSPWNIRLPTWRFGYWMSRRRCARSKNTIAAITTIASTMIARIRPVDRAPVRPSSSVPPMALGMPATMPAKMISEMPLPMPRAVICSPSHIRNMVPPTSVITAEVRKKRPGSVTMPAPLSRPTEMP